MLAACTDDNDFTPWPKGVTEKPKNAREAAARRRKVHNPKRAYDRTRTYCGTCRRVTLHSCPYGPPFRDAPSVYCLDCMTLNPTGCHSAADRKACKDGTVVKRARDRQRREELALYRKLHAKYGVKRRRHSAETPGRRSYRLQQRRNRSRKLKKR